jgi:hydrogenase maturation protease
MQPVLIIGYGNTLRGDDGVGPLAAEALSASAAHDGVDVMRLHQLAPELVEAVSRVEAVLFIDARSGGPAGEVRCEEISLAAPDNQFTHQLTPSTLLALTRQMYGRAPAGYEISVSGQSFELSEELSPAVSEAMPRLVGLARAWARELGRMH